ncbi:hypothetical protein AYO20_00304 [Fonsecaea nubica]|uniref:Uncharacterized protein n=1 Tax=Fonsecaea nubica TaxID=856822 RepID=A0A178DEX6_9EURO|nr:hypothetical protein AYO20_00304 [Fonsecaea nubica]OAL40568.1 hypothetical protein AYO20_00304 [Fonsecaea nubica]
MRGDVANHGENFGPPEVLKHSQIFSEELLLTTASAHDTVGICPRLVKLFAVDMTKFSLICWCLGFPGWFSSATLAGLEIRCRLLALASGKYAGEYGPPQSYGKLWLFIRAESSFGLVTAQVEGVCCDG